MSRYKATALSLAKVAERLLGEDVNFLENNPDVVPQLVNALFQSIEIVLKEVGNGAGLTNDTETRGRSGGPIGNGHDIEKLGYLLKDRLGVRSTRRLVQVFTTGIENGAEVILDKMIFGSEFQPTRNSYMRRKLVYIAELEEGDIQIAQGLKPWVDAVKAVAENTGMAIAIIKRWKDSNSTHSFEEWHILQNSFLNN